MIQNAPLMTKGMAAVGIRIDGCGNDVTVSRGVNVQADGPNGNGILAAFGKDHRITLAKGSKVTADGEGGIGAAFDFGQNSLGNEFGSRASYAARFFSQYVYGFEDMLDPDLLETDETSTSARGPNCPATSYRDGSTTTTRSRRSSTGRHYPILP